MFTNVSKAVKNEKGLTLIELLAVVVILAIIAAIAIPAIGGLIDNSKKDAHAANATQMINAAKLAVVGDETVRPDDGKEKYISLDWLQKNGYIEPINSPDGTSNQYRTGSSVTDAIPTTAGSYVLVKAAGNNLNYSVVLITNKRGVRDTTSGTGINEDDYVEETDVKRSVVK